MAKPPKDPEGLLRRAWETGHRRWPRVELPADVFILHVSRHLPEPDAERPLAAVIEQLDLEGLYLSCAYVNGVPSAAQALESDYLAKVPAVLGYLRLPAATLDDVCQQVRTHLLVRTPDAEPRLASYTGRGSLLSWIRAIAVRMALKQGASARETPDENAFAALENMPASGADAEFELLKRRYRHEFRQATAEAFSALSSEQRYLLRLHFIDQLPTTKMGPLFGKDQSTISRWLKDAREKVYEETKRRLQERLRLDSREFESFMDAIKSRFDMSLSQILNKEEDESAEGEGD